MSRTAIKDPNAFPYWQLTVLAICRFSEPIAFNSILAYSYPMMVDLLGGEEKDATFYAGLLVSAYAVAEALTAVFWGTLSDIYGRKPVVLGGLLGVAISCFILGFAKTYWVALLARLIGGALNGNVSVMQTMVAEMVKLPEHEPAAYATQPFVWTLGGIIGSAMGGFLAQPAKFYPHLFPADGLFGRYPYLLPNLASVVIILLAILQGMIFLEETNPRATDDTVVIVEEDVDEHTSLIRRVIPKRPHVRTTEEQERSVLADETRPMPVDPSFDMRRTSFGTMRSETAECEGGSSGSTTPRASEVYTGPVWNFSVVMIIIALIIASYHQMGFGALLPIHLLAPPRRPKGELDLVGGFGFTLHEVSVYLAVNGFISLFIQGFVFPPFVAKVGVWRSFAIMILLYPLVYTLLPFLSAFPKFASAGIYLTMLVQAFFNIIVTPTALILLKDATPSSTLLGRVNGLAMSGCCAARTLSPPLLGIIYSAGGSAAAWFSCSAVALIGVLQLIWFPKPGSRGQVNKTIITNEDETEVVEAVA